MSLDIRYRLLSPNGDVLFCNLNADEISLISVLKNQSGTFSLNGVKYRAASVNTVGGYGFVSSSSHDYVKSSRKFNTALDVVGKIIGSMSTVYVGIKSQVNDDTKRLLHNLISLNAHNLQEIYSLIPQDDLASKQSGHVEMVSEIIRRDTREFAISLLRILKNNVSMKTEFSVFKKLFDINPSLDKREHVVHKVIMNVFYLFFPDFTDKNIIVDVKASKVKAVFDYESMHVALYYLIENASKYTCPNSIVIVSLEDLGDQILVLFEMTSIQVKQEEIDAIFQEGYSGEIPKKLNKAGEGIGMSRVKRIVQLNNASISFCPDSSKLENKMGIPYQRNMIKLFLPKSYASKF